MINKLIIAFCILAGSSFAYSQNKPALKKATFGMGCFWCTEAVFQRVKGISRVESGYMGGTVKNPTYRQISTGKTGHAEVSQVRYDPAIISYAELLEIFWKMHDPTTLNRQGNDIGPQYRSVIFYHDAQQKLEAERYMAELNKAQVYPRPIVTQISAAGVFYKAEAEHQNYFNLNSRQPYCRLVIQPKVDKLEKVFKDKLKQNN
jgi:peptide-methionine (S)-S-oxide reductase